MEISIKPIVTEKATKLTEALNRYTFRVSPETNKTQIKSMVEELYGVKVTKVNTMIVRRKRKQRYTKDNKESQKEAKNSYIGLRSHTISIVIFSFFAIAALHRLVSSNS